MYVNQSNKYIADVLSGNILACDYIKQACKRQKDDLKRKRFEYRFDRDKANRICKFIELLPHVKGKWADAPFKLQPWQIFILTTIFGWVDQDGYRRYKTAYIEISRKNGKSFLSSAVALYLLGLDGEAGAEIVSAATTKDQAKIVWEDARRIVQRCEGLKKLGYAPFAHSVTHEKSGSSLKALARDQGGNLDGLNIHGAIVDELHAHKIRDVWDVIETATGSRTQPLIWAITTAGFNRAGICYEQRAYVIKILSKSIADEEYFGVIYTLDEKDDWIDEEVWIKANPNLDISVSREDLQRKARKAMEMAAAQNNFLTKHLNVWCNADTSWINMRDWDRCQRDIELSDFAGCPAWIGVDLASKVDLACVGILIAKDNVHYAFVQSFLNEEAVEDGRNSQYSGWAKDRLITVTPGNVTDYAAIEDEIKRLCTVLAVQEVVFDPHQAQYMMQNLIACNVPVVQYGQTVLNMSTPMKELGARICREEILHNGDRHLAWMVSNVVCHTDAKDNIYPRKEFAENKIDGVVALIMALARALTKADAVNSGMIFL